MPNDDASLRDQVVAAWAVAAICLGAVILASLIERSTGWHEAARFESSAAATGDDGTMPTALVVDWPRQ